MRHGAASRTTMPHHAVPCLPCLLQSAWPSLVPCGKQQVVADAQVQPGATLFLLARVQGGPQLKKEAAPVKLQVAYEDDHFGIVVKPQGMPTLKSGKASPVTAAQCIKYALTLKSVPGAQPSQCCTSYSCRLSMRSPTSGRQQLHECVCLWVPHSQNHANTSGILDPPTAYQGCPLVLCAPP
jgi:hypothetical protein